MDPLAFVSYIFQKYFYSTITKLTPRMASSIFLRCCGAMKVIMYLQVFRKKMVNEERMRVMNVISS